MDYLNLVEALLILVGSGAGGSVVSRLVFYPLYRQRGLSYISEQYHMDASRIDKGNATKLWLRIFKPMRLSPGLGNPELEELVENCHTQITGTKNLPEEVKNQAIAELLENPAVRSYLLV